jgi:hypothetical protein
VAYGVGATYGAGGFHAVVVDRADAAARRVRQAGPFDHRSTAIEWAVRELRQVEVLAALELADDPVHPAELDDVDDVLYAPEMASLAIVELVALAREWSPQAEAARREFVRRFENLESDAFQLARFEGASPEFAWRYAYETVGRTAEEVARRVLGGQLDDPALMSVERLREWLRTAAAGHAA